MKQLNMHKNYCFIIILSSLFIFACSDDNSDEPNVRSVEFSYYIENSQLIESQSLETLEQFDERIFPGDLTVFRHSSQVANSDQTEVIEFLSFLFELDAQTVSEFEFSTNLSEEVNLQLAYCLEGDCTDGFITITEGIVTGSQLSDTEWEVNLETSVVTDNSTIELSLTRIFEILVL